MDAGIGTAILLGSQAVLTGFGLRQSRLQEKVDSAKLDYESEQAKLAAQDQAFQNARSFSEQIGSQIAMAGARGKGTGLMQFTTRSFANFLMDQKSIERGVRNIETSKLFGQAEISGNRTIRDLNLISGLVGSTFSSINFNKPATSLQKVKGK